MQRNVAVTSGLIVILLSGVASANVLNMGGDLTSLELVTVGNPGNGADTRYFGHGAVDYVYQMGKFEVTAGQYTEFLNAVARADTYGLYDTNMGDVANGWGCNIQRAGTPGIYTYSVAPDWANRPVNWLTWGDAARFCNWLTRGQPTGSQDLTTTEDGSYYLNGEMSRAGLLAVTRKTVAEGGRYYIPTVNEWYKAAYHKNDGVTGNYWDYATATNSVPSNILINPDPGNNANFLQPSYTIGGPYFRTPVGEFENSASPYGTFDQGGNVSEWTEEVLFGTSRGIRGGSFYDGSNYMRADLWHAAWDPASPLDGFGLRIVAVPEPASVALLTLGVLGILARRREA
jgi:formylglycine-generating enzyme required for sulfatase activity